jgi:hypothetical protein
MATKESLKKKQFKEKEIVDEEYEYVTIPPDGGFGWVIAFAAMVFLVLLIMLDLFCLLI